MARTSQEQVIVSQSESLPEGGSLASLELATSEAAASTSGQALELTGATVDFLEHFNPSVLLICLAIALRM